jgi:hypothetical protein
MRRCRSPMPAPTRARLERDPGADGGPKGLLTIAGQAGKISADAVEQGRLALDRYGEAEQKAAAQGVNFAKVGVASQIQRLTQRVRSRQDGRHRLQQGGRPGGEGAQRRGKAAEAAKKGTGEFGKQIGFAEAADIAKSAGSRSPAAIATRTRPSSTTTRRSTAGQSRRGSRPSAHEGVNGKWALDIAFAPGLTADKLRKLYGRPGRLAQRRLQGEGHFHIEGSRSTGGRERARGRAPRRSAPRRRRVSPARAISSTPRSCGQARARRRLPRPGEVRPRRDRRAEAGTAGDDRRAGAARADRSPLPRPSSARQGRGARRREEEAGHRSTSRSSSSTKRTATTSRRRSSGSATSSSSTRSRGPRPSTASCSSRSSISSTRRSRSTSRR